jgi:hypothetical protein
MFAFAAVFPILAQRPPESNKIAHDRTIKLDKREIFVKGWVEDYNKRGKPIVEVKFEKLRPLSAELEKRLQQAFPKHQFTLVDLKFYHHAWWNESYSLLQSRKTDRVIWFNGPLNPYDKRGLDPYSNFLSAYPAKDETDALFKVNTLLEFLALVANIRIQEIKKYSNGFSFLVCSNERSITDLGATLYVPLNHKFMFGRLYFERNEWERNKCPVSTRI